jgi:hypothetical protein
MNDDAPKPFADFLSGIVWLLLAIGIVIVSWQMDRLEHLKVSVYSVPGLFPGILGIAIGIMGAILILRSVQAGALQQAAFPRFNPREQWRLLLGAARCVVFAAGVVGSGLPFWLAAAVFIAAFVFVFQFEERKVKGTLGRGAVFAVVYGLVCGVVIHYVFQELFLVRLP